MKTPTSRVDRLLGSMGYGSRTEMARLAKAGGVVLDGVDLTAVSKRIAVTPDLPSRMQIDGEPLDPPPGLALMLNKPLGMTSRCVEGACQLECLNPPKAFDPTDWRNCNGLVDDGDPGGGAPCDTGLVGVCAAGTLRCIAAALECTPDGGPMPEICRICGELYVPPQRITSRVALSV